LLHCAGCHLHHVEGAFSSNNRNPDKPDSERLCLGRQGAVRLCEHVAISWSTIEDHLDNWRSKQTPRGGWPACLADFKVECRHPSHETSCSFKETPIWPRARLRDSRRHLTPVVVLVLEWTPHRSVGAFVRGPQGRPLAAQLRSLFQGYRQQGQPAEFLMPAHLGQLPEMVCFDPSNCRCLHYETGNHDEDPESGRAADCGGPPQDAANLGFLSRDCPRRHSHRMDIDLYRQCDRVVEMRQHWPRRGPETSPCLITTYRHKVVVCDDMMAWRKGSRRTKLHPTHEWFHAMDPDTYPPPPGHEPPPCKDRGCMNYYKRSRSFTCADEPERMFSQCWCPRESTPVWWRRVATLCGS
jgi:hypothetical protein